MLSPNPPSAITTPGRSGASEPARRRARAPATATTASSSITSSAWSWATDSAARHGVGASERLHDGSLRAWFPA